MPEGGHNLAPDTKLVLNLMGVLLLWPIQDDGEGHLVHSIGEGLQGSQFELKYAS